MSLGTAHAASPGEEKTAESSKEKKKNNRVKARKARQERAAGAATPEAETEAAPGTDALAARLDRLGGAIRRAQAVAKAASVITPEEAAARLVAAQLLLDQGEAEAAGIVFLELAEATPTEPSGIQARFFLGEALYRLEMATWAAECFQRTLATAGIDAERFHQRALGRLLDLAHPRRDPGFARRPGLSALPELRGRLRALGLPTVREAPRGGIDDATLATVVARIAAIEPEAREAGLTYAYGRFLHLRGEHLPAIVVLDALNTEAAAAAAGQAIDRGLRLRAAYLAGVAALAAGEVDDALDRFAAVIRSPPGDPVNRPIVDLAWLARARINHDRGDYERALKGYRRLGRASPYYFTALYEITWTLIRLERFDLAGATLDRLMSLESGAEEGATAPTREGALAPELRQLRAKLRILQGDLEGAEAAFTALQDELGARATAARGSVAPPEYYAAVASGDLEGFRLESALPPAATAVLPALPRAAQAEAIARTLGTIERELAELRAQVTRMEAAVDAPERARLFRDLGAEEATLVGAEAELLEVMEILWAEVLAGAGAGRGGDLEARRRQLRRAVDEPLSPEERQRGARPRIARIDQFLGGLEGTIAGGEAEVRGLGRALREAAAAGAAPGEEAIAGLITAHDELAALKGEAQEIRDTLGGVEVALRFDDPYRSARARAVAAYRAHLQGIYSALAKAGTQGQRDDLWRRAVDLAEAVEGARGALDAAAERRLARALEILREERATLEGLRGELLDLRGRVTATVGEVAVAAHRDVAGELTNWGMRAAVGALDVVTARKEQEAARARELERRRGGALREVERALDLAEELGR